jgi:hypothetical protein
MLSQLNKEEYEWLEAHPYLSQDIKWIKPPSGIKRNGQPLMGYRMDFIGKTIIDYEILMKFIAKNMSEKRSVVTKRNSLFRG